jgi:hypothetical protein
MPTYENTIIEIGPDSGWRKRQQLDECHHASPFARVNPVVPKLATIYAAAYQCERARGTERKQRRARARTKRATTRALGAGHPHAEHGTPSAHVGGLS